MLRDINGMHNNSTHIREIVVDDVWIRDEYEISNVMNDYFSNLEANLTAKLRGEIDRPDPLQYLDYETQQFSFSDVSVDSVCKVITNLNNSRSTTMFHVITMYVYKDNLNA